ncbi:MAG: BatA domain-containing protein [Natronomonas sp.]
MALPVIVGFLQNPLGLLGLAALIPLVVLYLVRPDPRRYDIPTIEFLTEGDGNSTQKRIRDRLRISTLLLLQILVLVSIPLAMAGPQLPVPGGTPSDTVVVVDTSASMATETEDGETRLTEAVAEATAVAGDDSTVVTSAPEPRVRVAAGDGNPTAALERLSVTETDGDLRRAITVATEGREDPTQIVVVSDFVDASDWATAVESARAAGHDVDLRQIDGGGDDNVGIVDLSTRGTTVTATVANGGETNQQRTVTLGNQSETVELAPGDVADVRFSIPDGGGEIRLTPADSFPLDDVAYVSTPTDGETSVLVVTNDENAFLTTALGVMDDVRVDVAAPPVSDPSGYDVVVFSNVDPDRLLDGTVAEARSTAEDGGGVIVQSQPELTDPNYGDLALIDPDELGAETNVRTTQSHPIVDGIDFVSARSYVAGELERGETLAEADDGSPMIAAAETGDGQMIYYGYIEDDSDFNLNHQYPIFWRQAILYADGRVTLEELNHETGDTIDFESPTTVETPAGAIERDVSTLQATETGFYETSEERHAVSLRSPTESATAAEPVAEATEVAESGSTPVSLAPWLALAAVVVSLLELGYIKRRGEL